MDRKAQEVAQSRLEEADTSTIGPEGGVETHADSASKGLEVVRLLRRYFFYRNAGLVS